ncbi:MAG: hypothetical protein GX175_03730 [Halanaerobiaceae bacterium]|nr:hypothetical protein [Halanaerobiaceae bacterium]
MGIKRVLGLAFVYIGAVIGAGFASGQEIWYFIARHQEWGICSIFIIAVYFIILAPVFFIMTKKSHIENYQEFFYNNLPVSLAHLLDIIFSCFLLGSVSVMTAGSGTLFSNFLGLPYFAGAGMTISFILIVMKQDLKGIFTVNSIMIPFLIIITIYIVVFTIINENPAGRTWYNAGIAEGDGTGWLEDGLKYGAYNLIMAVAAMTNIVSTEKEKNILIGGVIGGIILSILIIIIYLGLIFFYRDIPVQEIPLLYLAKNTGKGGYLSYIFALYFAMITTALTNYYAFTKRFASLLNISYERCLIPGLLLVLPLLPSGFTELVNKMYPLFGGISIIITFFYLLIYFKIRKR